MFSARASQWAKLLSAFFTVQTVNQALALGTGLLLVRSASKEVFALYALATSTLTFFNTASDLGATGALIHFFRRDRQGTSSFPHILEVVSRLRRSAFWIGAPIAVAVFGLLAIRQGYGGWTVAACAIALVVGVGFQIPASIGLELRRLRGELALAYRAEIAGNLTRLLAASVLATSGSLLVLSGAPAACAATVLGTALTFGLVRRSVQAPFDAARLPHARRQLTTYLLPTLPSSLYFAIQGPMVTWLAATFGSAAQIADVGALGRLGLLISVLSPLPGVLLLPRLAVVTHEPLYWRRAGQFAALFVALLAPFVLISWLAPAPLLWILGPRYAGLEHELPLAMASTALGVFGGYLVGLTRARGYTRWDGKAVLALAGSQALLAASLPLGTVSGVLSFGVGTAATGALLQVAILYLGRRAEAAA
jgi:O-antigen/teichoic acid export membrane protein